MDIEKVNEARRQLSDLVRLAKSPKSLEESQAFMKEIEEKRKNQAMKKRESLPKNLDDSFFKNNESSRENLIETSFPLFDPQNMTASAWLVEFIRNEIKDQRNSTYREKVDPLKDELDSSFSFIDKNYHTSFLRFFQTKKTKQKLEEEAKKIIEISPKIVQMKQEVEEGNRIDLTVIEGYYEQNYDQIIKQIKTLLHYNRRKEDFRFILGRNTLSHLLSKVEEYDSRLKNKDEQYDVKKNYESLIQREVEKEFKKITLQEVNAITPLSFSSPEILYYTVDNIEQFKDEELKLLFEMEENQVDQLRTELADFKKEYAKNRFIKLETKANDLEMRRVFESLYYQEHRTNEIDEALKEAHHEIEVLTENAIELTKERFNDFRNLMNKKELEDPEEVVDFFYHLGELVEQVENKIEALFIEIPPIEALFKAFKKDSAQSYANLENFAQISNRSSYGDLTEYEIQKIKEFPLDEKGLHFTLRPYQRFGTQFAMKFKKTLLGDEMGLGKTIQSLAMMNHLTRQNKIHHIVFMPLSVLTNWKNEIDKWTNLSTFIFRDRERETAFKDWKKSGGVLLLNYEQSHHLLSYEKEFPEINSITIDEAQSIKNPETRRSENLSKMMAYSEYLLLMSGTPLENKVKDMNTLMGYLDRDLFFHLEQMGKFPLEALYKKAISNRYLRRKREDVLKELPERQDIMLYSSFGKIQQTAYDEAVDSGMAGLQAMRYAAFEGSKNNSEKIQQILNIVEEAKKNRKKVLIFSFFREKVLNKLQQILEKDSVGMINGSKSSKQRMELIEELENG